MKVGIFFGGQSREREISFAGGRTIYDNLDKNLFEAVPIFVDSLGNFILLDWQYLYKGTIRDFYPPATYQPQRFQIYIESLAATDISSIITQVGRQIYPHEFKNLIDFAFLAFHGAQGEDGAVQGLLEWYGIPYSGSGILPSAIGISKSVQQDLFSAYGFRRPQSFLLSKSEFLQNPTDDLLNRVAFLGTPLVIKAPHQGSSIGVSIIRHPEVSSFHQALLKAFFMEELSAKQWLGWSIEQKWQYLTRFTDIREGTGFPANLEIQSDHSIKDLGIVSHPELLEQLLDEHLTVENNTALFTSVHSEQQVLIEQWIEGKEFSCIVVINEQGEPLALPPTRIIKGGDLFDYRSKYLPGMSRKITPIDLPAPQIEQIRHECCRLFKAMKADVYARIDGFINSQGEVFLNDPNTTSGMLPSSFFFHQAAEIGLNPSQFLTYIIRTSLAERLKVPKNTYVLSKQLQYLDDQIVKNKHTSAQKINVAVIMGGYSTERHISIESGRNIYEKLASSTRYEPIPLFLTGNDEAFELYQIPVNVMLKDNADDIREKILQYEHLQGKEILQKIQQEAASITDKYTSHPLVIPKKISYQELAQMVEVVFIALHGRPGEDGTLQKELEKVGLPYNGSGIESSKITINKFETNEILGKHGISVAKHRLVYKHEWQEKVPTLVAQIEKEFVYPFIAKPADDGCSSAVKKIKNREALEAFMEMMFRAEPAFIDSACQVLQLKASEEFPQKNFFLIEDLITAQAAIHFLEITGGMLIRQEADKIKYEIFEPSETLATGEVLSLEEKFLAGEGQNITPARFSKDPAENKRISQEVRATLQKTAEILNLRGYTRIDAFVRIFEDGQVETIIIEINSLPGMTPATVIFHQAALNGYKPYDFIEAILQEGMKVSSITSGTFNI